MGEGPLVRVLEVRREGGVVNGYDPFTRRLETTFSTAQAQHIGDQGYAIQRFGYSATATKTMSLTFDDGPDPRWTPELLNVLSANKVPATFFATGTMIARHPEIIRREVREGHAIANHSLTHTDVSDTSRWRARTELVATDRVIRAVTGQEVGYFRLPYEGDDEKTTQATIDGILRAQRYGYLVTSHDFDTDDWAYASRERKGEIPLPPLTGQNITMLMHDGGGEGRKLTVDYVRRLIPYAKAHGYTFQTMPQAQPQLADRVSTVRPTVWDQLTLKVVQAIYVWPSVVLQVLFLFALASVILIGAVNCLLAAHRHRSRARQEWPGPGQRSCRCRWSSRPTTSRTSSDGPLRRSWRRSTRSSRSSSSTTARPTPPRMPCARWRGATRASCSSVRPTRARQARSTTVLPGAWRLHRHPGRRHQPHSHHRGQHDPSLCGRR